MVRFEIHVSVIHFSLSSSQILVRIFIKCRHFSYMYYAVDFFRVYGKSIEAETLALDEDFFGGGVGNEEVSSELH